MRKIKKIISLFMLMIIFLSVIQNIVLGATTISEGNLKKGNAIETNVKFDNGSESYVVQANYIYYKNGNNEYPAYCISHRIRWCR